MGADTLGAFLGGFIGSGIMVFISSMFFYRLGRKHERELNVVDKRIYEFRTRNKG